MRAKLSDVDYFAGVASGLTVVAVVAGLRWLRLAENRERLRQALCRHEWKEVEPITDPNVIWVTGYSEKCRKCGATR